MTKRMDQMARPFESVRDGSICHSGRRRRRLRAAVSALNSTGQSQNNYDDQKNAHNPPGAVSPRAAIAPSRKGANQ